jgi:hypothetical protein
MPRRVRPGDDCLTKDVRRVFEKLGLIVLGPAVACMAPRRLTPSRKHVQSQDCWCGPWLIQRETLLCEEEWLHRTKYEAD